MSDTSTTSLIATIKAHIAKGDKAKEKADQHYIAAGLHLKKLKAQHSGSWREWEMLLKSKIGIGKSRASELMAIADGRKTVEQVRDSAAGRIGKTRALRAASSPQRCGEKEANKPTPVAPGTDWLMDYMVGDAKHQGSPEPSRGADIGADSTGEIERKDARIDELEAEKRRLEIRIASLEAENAELRERLEAANDDGLDIPASLRRGLQ